MSRFTGSTTRVTPCTDPEVFPIETSRAPPKTHPFIVDGVFEAFLTSRFSVVSKNTLPTLGITTNASISLRVLESARFALQNTPLVL